MMQEWQVSQYNVKSLAVVDVPTPTPAPHQILVKVGAVSLNYREKLALDGEFGRDHELPIVPASARGLTTGVRSIGSKPRFPVPNFFEPFAIVKLISAAA
jgi:hypothetical protein